MRAPLFSRGNNPFSLAPDPRFAFASSSYQAAVEMLQRGLDRRIGPMLLIGPAGCGKTMLLRALQDRVVQNGGLAFFREFFPFNPNLRFDPDDAIDNLLCSFLAELRHEPIPPDRAEREQALGQYIERLPPRAHAVLLLDDAHRFDESDRDLILLPQRQNALQLILAGGADLVERYQALIQASHTGVGVEAPRAPVVIEIGPLMPGEVAPYVAHRLAIARIRQSAETAGTEPFQTAALERVFVHSKGVPRVVNRLCASALSTDPQVVDAARIDAAAVECGLMRPLFSYRRAATVPIGRGSEQRPSDRFESSEGSASSAVSGRGLLWSASALAAALGVAGILYFGGAYLDLNGAGSRAPVRQERPAVPDMIRAVAPTIPITGVALSPGLVGSAEPASESESGAQPRADSRSSEEKDKGPASPFPASEQNGELAAGNAPEATAPALPTGTEATSAGTTDRTDGDVLIGSESQSETDAVIEGVFDGSRAGEDLLSSRQDLPSVSRQEAEQPPPRNDNTEAPSTLATPPDRIASGDGDVRQEPPRGSRRSDRRSGDFTASATPEVQTARAAPPPPQSATLDAERLVARGYSLFDMGDPASARLFFERAASQGHAGAMLAAGETFDPLELQRRRILGVRGEPDRALDWYRRSAEAGDRAAEERLARLNDWISRRANQR